MREAFDINQYSQEQVAVLLEQALSVLGTKGVEALTPKQRSLLLQLTDSIDNAALTLGSTPEIVMEEAKRNPETFLDKVRQARDFLTRRGGGQH